MEIVTLSDLQKLVDHTRSGEGLEESFFFGSKHNDEIGPGFSFSDICKKYKKHQAEVKAQLGDIAFLNQKMHNWMRDEVLKKHCPPIKLVGQGSSRTAYACLGGKCLKVAMSDIGIAQSKQEAKNTQKGIFKRVPECFVQTYGSSSGYELLLSECCALIKSEKELAEALGMSDFEILKAVVKGVCQTSKIDLEEAASDLRDKAHDLRRQGKDFSAMMTWAGVADAGADWIEKLLRTRESKMTPGQRSLAQVFAFWKKSGVEELMPGDVITEKNWGFAIRRNRIAPVMLDCGFSAEVSKKYYG